MESAGSIVREARRRAGLTQSHLAKQANVEQSVISAYETGARAPSLHTLRRLVNAAGYDLAVELVARPTVSPLRAALDLNRKELVSALRALGASRIRVFGSVARGDDGPDSDIDLLVDVDDSVGLFALSAMNVEAERILNARVDVVPVDGVKPAYADQILAEAVEI